MLIATFDLNPEAVALSQTLTEVPGIDVQAERIAAHATTWTLPCIWIGADDFSTVDETLAADQSVDSIVERTEFIDEKYYQVEWTDEVAERIDTYLDHKASILNARGTGDGWRIRIRFASRDQFDEFRDTLHEQDHSFGLQSIVQPEDARRPVTELTHAQQEAMEAAQRHGYYKVPREITARELAEELGMSHQNLSKLLRRGTEKLLDASLETPNGSEEPDPPASES